MSASHLAGQMTQAFAARDRSRVENYDLANSKDTEPVSELRVKKQTKAHAGYRSAFSGARCASCVHMRGAKDKEGTCEIVEGEIRGDDVCDLYGPERENETTNADNYFRSMVERYAKPSDDEAVKEGE